MAAEFLMKKGKRATAAYVQASCKSKLSLVHDVFEVILNPIKAINDAETIEWVCWLLASGRSPEEFAQIVRKYDSAATCGLVWTTNFVAYRCRTCGISPCMSLCAECFQQGDHEGHDFNMFRSQAGGACDCGDKSVMKEFGFCKRHGPKNQLKKPEVPPDLLVVAEAIMPLLFLRLIQHLRDTSTTDYSDKTTSAIIEADDFISMLHSHSELGAAMHEIMTHALTSTDLYAELALDCESSNPEKTKYFKSSLQNYVNAKNDLDHSLSAVPFNNEDPPWSNDHDLRHSSFLDELVFWTVKYEFPQKLVCLLLNMMPVLSYKEEFTKTFVHHYHRISKMLVKSSDSDTLSNRVVHVSVQLFSNKDLALKMTKEFSLLHIMVHSLKEIMLGIAQQSVLQCLEKNTHLVVDCSHRIMKEHCYWFLVTDLNNVLTHKAVAFEFLSDISLLQMWFSFLSLFQGMNVNKRELKNHVEFESNSYYAAFSAELEASATPMWAQISHLKTPETLKKTKVVLSECLRALDSWFHAIGFSLEENINSYQVSFHIPLHRSFACFLGQAVRQQGAQLSELLPSQDMLKLMMMHPLQAQVAFYEILCGMWVRSGLQMKGQAMTYIQCHFCNSIVDADLFLLQLCCTHLDPDWFLSTVLQRFHVWDWFSLNPYRRNSFLEPEHVLPMLEGALTFLCTLVSTHTNIGMSNEEVMRQEMVSLLCMADRTHSQLMDLIPDKCGALSQNKDLESILSEVADYKAPNFEIGGNMLQGTYVPKPKIWEEEYDPIHILLRAVHRREYQSSLDRFAQFLRQSGKFSESKSPWPPYRIPSEVSKEFFDPRKVLHCKTMLGIVFIILYRAVIRNSDIPEQILSMCVYLLDMAVRFPGSSSDQVDSTTSWKASDLNFDEWFSSNNVLSNVNTCIKLVVMTEKAEQNMRMVEEMEVEEEEVEEEEADAGMDHEDLYDVQSPTAEEDFPEHSQQSLPPIDQRLALPAGTANSNMEAVSIIQGSDSTELVLMSNPPEISANALPTLGIETVPALPSTSNDLNMALISRPEDLTTVRYRRIKLRPISGRHRMLLTDKGLPLCIGDGSSQVPFFRRALEVNESILSLLLRLHSKLSEKADSYRSPSERNETVLSNTRVGDGTLFVGSVLDRLAVSDDTIEQSIQDVRQKLWPKKAEATTPRASENLEKEERRRRAKERQQKLMAEFASRQKAFMQKTMEADCKESTEDGEKSETLVSSEKEYDCVICGQTACSDEVRPMGMVVLLQATSVLGHRSNKAPRKLPCSENEVHLLQGTKKYASDANRRVEQLTRHFDNKHWQMAVNIGWEGGVHVQSCGHYLHIDCHKSYIQSLKCQNQVSSRLQNLAVDRGEYSCPLCRQLANSVIPLSPLLGENSALVRCHTSNIHDIAVELRDLMSCPLSATVCGSSRSHQQRKTAEAVVHKLQWTFERYRHHFEKIYFNLQDKFTAACSGLFVNDTNNTFSQFFQAKKESNMLKKYMVGIMEDLTNATYPIYRALCAPNSSSLFLFVCSMLRTNLEIELVQRGGKLSTPSRKKSCFAPLLHVLSMHSRLLSQSVPSQLWNRLTGQALPEDLLTLAVCDEEIPLLLRDCIALLLQIVLTVPLNLDKAYFNCIVQVLYNLLYVQRVAQLTCHFNKSERNFWRNWKSSQNVMGDAHCTESDAAWIIMQVIEHLEPSSLYLADDEMDTMLDVQLSLDWVDTFIKKHCIHFLRIASLLQAHLYEDSPVEVQEETEFETLCQYLGLFQQVGSPAACHRWATWDPGALIRTWCEDFAHFADKSVIAARGLLDVPEVWQLPGLLSLPRHYDDVFQFYHRRPCVLCHREPKDPSVCLVCGTLVCLREICCRTQMHYEAVMHSMRCGAGTALFLAVNSSTVIVIRGKRACLWGSVYLDGYGEEDRDLKRGKPLFLSEERYNLLQDQWRHHSFDHTNKRWVWHKDNL